MLQVHNLSTVIKAEDTNLRQHTYTKKIEQDVLTFQASIKAEIEGFNSTYHTHQHQYK